ncbi:MAG: threonylcarbamoyl-AMP synthase [candidate division SR1 bacterium]|nr:threonylcarbamoyl-AMP synthase [candidate division SR1 bacterium]
MQDMRSEEIAMAVNFLKNGGVVVFPTDTVYGIGALPDEIAVEKLYQIKKRDHSKKIIALIGDRSRLAELIDEKPDFLEKITPVLQKFWPGELTVIFRAKLDFTKKFDQGLATIGVRIPKNQTALDIIRGAGGIILTTSANISGEPSIISLEKLNPQIRKEIDMEISDTSTLTGTPSTIILYEDGEIKLLREGNISLEEIKKVFDRQDC